MTELSESQHAAYTMAKAMIHVAMGSPLLTNCSLICILKRTLSHGPKITPTTELTLQ
jgi:hypothetical protein